MSETKHTPGPWFKTGRTISAEGSGVCVLSYTKDAETLDANAALIAAAPDLLEALKAYRGFYAGAKHEGMFASGKEKLDRDTAALIAKAEGRA